MSCDKNMIKNILREVSGDFKVYNELVWLFLSNMCGEMNLKDEVEEVILEIFYDEVMKLNLEDKLKFLKSNRIDWFNNLSDDLNKFNLKIELGLNLWCDELLVELIEWYNLNNIYNCIDYNQLIDELENFIGGQSVRGVDYFKDDKLKVDNFKKLMNWYGVNKF